jgi:hypothetical protein
MVIKNTPNVVGIFGSRVDLSDEVVTATAETTLFFGIGLDASSTSNFINLEGDLFTDLDILYHGEAANV